MSNFLIHRGNDRKKVAIQILPAEPHDLEQILLLQKKAYLSEAVLLNDFDIAPLHQTLSQLIIEFEEGVILKAVDSEKKDRILGSIRGILREKTLHIGKLMVEPDFQNRGIGQKLLLAIEALFPDARYELFTSNRSDKNLMLYHKNGYLSFKTTELNQDACLVFLEKNG